MMSTIITIIAMDEICKTFPKKLWKLNKCYATAMVNIYLVCTCVNELSSAPRHSNIAFMGHQPLPQKKRKVKKLSPFEMNPDP